MPKKKAANKTISVLDLIITIASNPYTVTG